MRNFEIDGRNVWNTCELIIKSELGISQVEPDANLMTDYRTDSLDIINIVVQCGSEFNVKLPEDAIPLNRCTLSQIVQQIIERYEV